MGYKVFLYFEGLELIKKSGIGKAYEHQSKALNSVNIDFTTTKDDNYDILHINTVGIKSKSIINRSIKSGKKIVYHAHTTEEDFRDSFLLSNQVSGVFKKHLQRLYGKADVIITPTPYSKQILEGYNLDTPIFDVSNGIDLNEFKKSEENAQLFRDHFNFSNDDFVVISVGHYFKRKGIIDFIEIARQNPHLKFVWFGHTPQASIQKDVRIALKNLPTNLYLPGYMDGKIISGAYSGANIFLFMSHEETEGIVVLEALASEIQVIVRDIPVYADWLENNVSCYKASTNETFNSLLNKAYSNQLTSTIDNGYLVAQERDINAIGIKLKEIYDYTLSLPPKQR